ncbi:MAG: hypothetical protein KA314_18920 [Chloroflexi bacterium]|nr:hypothetical protein [Chloroflexota bacterium]MBP8057907.1 hypothetical protein [Chloroflexota bacterium]
MKLIPLICPECNTPLKPDNEDVMTVCPQCQRFYQLGQQGLRPLAVQFRSTGQTMAKEWMPFWVFQGKVVITERQTQGGSNKSAQAAEQLWSSPRVLYVPAWDLPVNRVQEIGGAMIQQQPVLQHLEQPDTFRLRPAIITAADAQKMLEFIILAIEARREDYLKNLVFHLQVGEGVLWALPQ